MNASERYNYTLSEGIHGPVIATFVGVEFILSLAINLFICLHTCISANGRKSIKKSSTIFLFGLALSNLMMAVLYMPFVIIASGAEEWIFGSTEKSRNVLCQIHGFIFAYATSTAVHTIAAISFDRFLFIVKPHLHKRFMTWKTSLLILVIIWIASVLIDLTPYFGLGEYQWASSIGGCLPLWVGNRDYVLFFSLLGIIPLTIIVVTSVWTFIFTRGYLRRHLKEERAQSFSATGGKPGETQSSVYSEKIRNLFGVFGTLLIFNVLTSLPYISASIIGLIVGLDRIPTEVYTTVFVLFLLSNVTNPVVQAYFRKELLDSIKMCAKKVCFCCVKDTAQAGKLSQSYYDSGTHKSTNGILHSELSVNTKMVTLVAHGNDPLPKERSSQRMTSSSDGVSLDHVTDSNGHVTISMDGVGDHVTTSDTNGHVTTPDSNNGHVTIQNTNGNVTTPIIDNNDHVTKIALESDSHVTLPDSDDTCNSIENGGNNMEENEVEE